MIQAATERFCERAAIREFDGGAQQDEAEVMAIGDVANEYGWPAVVAVVLRERNKS